MFHRHDSDPKQVDVIRPPGGYHRIHPTFHLCYTEKAPQLLAPPRKTKDWKHLQSTQTTVNRHNSQSKHQALLKRQRRSQDALNQPAQQPPRHHNPHPTGSSPDPLSQAAKHRRHYNTDTTRLSGDTQRLPPLLPSVTARHLGTNLLRQSTLVRDLIRDDPRRIPRHASACRCAMSTLTCL